MQRPWRLLTAACAASLPVAITACTVGARRAEPTPSAADEVTNVTWEWVSTITPVARIAVEQPDRYTLLLQDDGRARVRFDCNQGGGPYEMAPGRLSFGPLMSTRMACPADTQDAAFMRDLQRVVSYVVRDGDLFLELPADSGTMRFRRAR